MDESFSVDDDDEGLQGRAKGYGVVAKCRSCNYFQTPPVAHLLSVTYTLTVPLVLNSDI